jgi:hypothetical protein
LNAPICSRCYRSAPLIARGIFAYCVGCIRELDAGFHVDADGRAIGLANVSRPAPSAPMPRFNEATLIVAAMFGALIGVAVGALGASPKRRRHIFLVFANERGAATRYLGIRARTGWYFLTTSLRRAKIFRTKRAAALAARAARDLAPLRLLKLDGRDARAL